MPKKDTRVRKGSASNRLGKTALCKVQVACDGLPVVGKRAAGGVCARCEEAAAKRGKVLLPSSIGRVR
jgi:hypothetical protein